MKARTVTTAAALAALIALGLALSVPRASRPLRPGARGAPPAPKLAAAIVWPAAAPAAAGRSEAAAAATAPEPDRPEEEREDAGAYALRDALSAPGPAASAAVLRVGSANAAPRSSRVARAGPWTGLFDAAASAPEEEPGTDGRAAAGRRSAAAPPPRVRPPVFPARPRVPLARGPAGTEDEPETLEEEDARGPSASPAGRAAARSRLRVRIARRPFPLFRPPKGSARRDAAGRARRVKPPLLAKLLGRGALRPPKSSLAPPDLSRLDARRPASMPHGGPVPSRRYDLEELEGVKPSASSAPSCRKRKPHWHEGLWHDGQARGLTASERWLWLWRDERRVWAAPEPSPSPLLSHQGLWWKKMLGVWFAVHEGQLWTWRRFSEWDADGLLRLTDGVEIVYSADFTRAAVITPGAGAVLYDAATGAELGRWREDELPRRRPRPPADLRLPRGI